MAITPIRALLFLLGGSAAATAAAYVSGAFDPNFGDPAPPVAELPSAPSGAAPAKGDRLPGEAPQATAPAEPAPSPKAAGAPVPASGLGGTKQKTAYEITV